MFGSELKPKKKAISLGLTGFVKNQADGTVYIEAEGPSERMNLFLAWCKVGPRLAHVSDLEESTADVQQYTSFEIR